MMKHIVYDCDNTFGVPNCDVDDGLALIYLLGNADAKVHGITATYGNNHVSTVYNNTMKMLETLGRSDITLKKGGANAMDCESEAGKYLASMARKYRGELSILATGSLTNLKSAYYEEPHFFEYVKEIVLMGGITKPLIFEKKQMDELNFSCDPEASYLVLTKGKNVSVITGNNCLKVLFTRQEYKKEFADTNNPMAKFIREETDYWFGFNEEGYGIEGFYNWDVTAAVYLMHPELFEDKKGTFEFSQEDLKTGFLRKSECGHHTCNLPEIGEELPFKRNIYDSWLRVPVGI